MTAWVFLIMHLSYDANVASQNEMSHKKILKIKIHKYIQVFVNLHHFLTSYKSAN